MSDAAAARPALDKRRSIALGIFALAVIVLIFVRVIPQVGSYKDAAASLKTMTTGSLAGIVVTVAAYLAVYGLPFMAATPGLSYRRAQQLNQGAFAISNGVPAGGVFGLGVQYAMLASYGVSPTVSTAAMTAVSVWSMFVTLGLPVLGVTAIALSGQGAASATWPAVVGLLSLSAAIGIFALIVRSERAARRTGSAVNWVAAPFVRRFRKGRSVDFVPTALRFRSDIAALVTRRWAAITASQLSVSLTQFVIFYVALRSVQGWGAAGTPLLIAFGSFAVAQIGLMIPITPGGLGTVDAAMIALLTSLGVDPGVATAADLVWRAASFIPQILIGVGALATWSRQGARALAAREAARRERAAQV